MIEILAWWNLVYVLAFLIAFLYVLLSAIGVASGEGGADAGPHFEAHAEVGGHIEADQDLGGSGADNDAGDTDVVVPAGADAHVDAAHAAHGVFQETLSLFGVGRVPLSVVLITFLLVFAVVGWTLNLALSRVIPLPIAFFPISFIAATLCGMGGTRLLAATLGRWLRPMESAALPRQALVGGVGTACLPVTAEFGNVLVRDTYGTLHKVVCRVPPGAPVIPKGQSVLLVRYERGEVAGHRSGGYYLVKPYDLPVS